MTIYFYILSIWGLTHILVSSSILSNIRDWFLIYIPFIGRMLNCYQCTSFWVSMILYFCFDIPNVGINLLVNIEFLKIDFRLDVIIWGFIGSGLISIFSVIFSYLIKK